MSTKALLYKKQREEKVRCDKTKSEKIQTNPRYQSFTQSIFTAGDEDQFDNNRKKGSLISGYIDLSNNMFSNLRLENIWNKYENLDCRSVYNTFRYMFYKFKKGIFVRIENNKLVTYLPFSNARYVNELSELIKADPKQYKSIQELIDRSSILGGYRPSNTKAIPIDEWIPNNSIFRYEYQKNEGDNNVETIRNMIDKLCSERSLPDIEFFINRRDYPLLKRNGTEPYNHAYGTSFKPLMSHKYDNYSPILSGSIGDDNADILFPTYEDWARASYQENGNVFPKSCRTYPNIENGVKWADKKSIAVFRGSTTGAGTTPETNQRLNALELSLKYPSYLDIGITKWNLRPRKYESDNYLRTIERLSYPLSNSLSLQEQSNKYKYILNLEGHVSAYRLSYELSSGSVVLLAGSKWKMWYSDLLEPYIHYVPIKADLSDLIDRINWCRDNDDECELIADTAKQFYIDYLSTKGILDYLQNELVQLSKTIGYYKYLPESPSTIIRDIEAKYISNIKSNDTIYPYQFPQGPRCIGRLDGSLIVFRSKDTTLTFIKNIFKNNNGSIDLFKTKQGIYVVRKRANNIDKEREHNHEVFIGLTTINKLVSKVPNFAYVYGNKPDVDENDFHKNDVYIEYINGITLSQWILSDAFNFTDLVKILMQVNLAIKTAQDYSSFVHYDLYPWNIMIQIIPGEPIKFQYPIDYGYYEYEPYLFETNIIPVIIDFGKSRAVVYNGEDNGMIDHGIVNTGFGGHQMLDTITLLYSIIKEFADTKFTANEKKWLLSYINQLKLPVTNISKWSKYSALFNEIEKVDRNINPYNFVVYLSSHFQFENRPGKFYQNIKPSYRMEKGNALYTETLMKTGQEKDAFLSVIYKVDKSTIPITDNETIKIMLFKLLLRKLDWLDEQINIKGDQYVKKLWLKTKQLLFDSSHNIKSYDIDTSNIPFPISYIYLDNNVTPEYIRDQNKDISIIEDNWMLVWMLFAELAYINLDVYHEGFDLDNINSFEWFGNIASNNVVCLLNKNIIQ